VAQKKAVRLNETILETQGLCKNFGRFTALRDVSAGFRRGRLTGIIGPNGAGKSTYFNMLSGAFPPSAGRIMFEGRDITGTPQHRFAAMGIAKSFQITTVFPGLSTQENVRVALQALVSRYDVWRSRARLPGLIDQACGLLDSVGLRGATAWPPRWRTASSGRWR
jgi:branched-chain amino acid transport system ATP-binding protein